jgi:hypothetical protein
MTKTQKLIRTLLRTRKGSTYTLFTAQTFFMEEYGLAFDVNELYIALTALCDNKEAEIIYTDDNGVKTILIF